MARAAPPPLPDVIRAELDRLGLPWEVLRGKKHWKLMVSGRLAVVMSRGPARESEKHRRQNLNAVRAIRRVAREMGQ